MTQPDARHLEQYLVISGPRDRNLTALRRAAPFDQPKRVHRCHSDRLACQGEAPSAASNGTDSFGTARNHNGLPGPPLVPGQAGQRVA